MGWSDKWTKGKRALATTTQEEKTRLEDCQVETKKGKPTWSFTNASGVGALRSHTKVGCFEGWISLGKMRERGGRGNSRMICYVGVGKRV